MIGSERMPIADHGQLPVSLLLAANPANPCGKKTMVGDLFSPSAGFLHT
jgi:hypothetical protein